MHFIEYKYKCCDYRDQCMQFHQVKPTGFYRNDLTERPTGPISYRDDLRIYREVWPMVNSGLPHIDTGRGLADG